jgi:hypothetical protein
LARKDWAAGKIKSNETSQLTTALIMAVVLGGIGMATCLRLPGGWHKVGFSTWIALAFLVGGLLFLISFINGLRTRWRFGHCCFVPSGVPIPLGGVLEGTIQTDKPLRLEQDLRLTISCIQQEKRGKHSFQSILWQDEKCYSANASFIETEPGHIAIPVRFKLPGDQPECCRSGRVSVCWRLEARSQMHGPAFHECFDLPVFNISSIPAPDPGNDDAIPAAGNNNADPTAGLLAGVEEIRQDQNSRIQVGIGPHGQEFYFPAARNVGDALLMTVAALLFDGAPVLLIRLAGRDAFALIVCSIMGLVFGLVGLLFTCLALNAWFKSSRVTVDSTGVHAHDHWLFFFHRSRDIAAGDIDHFEIESRSSSSSPNGAKACWDVQICTRSARESGQAAEGLGAIILAKNIADKAEAQWLADQMARALGRQPFPARA